MIGDDVTGEANVSGGEPGLVVQCLPALDTESLNLETAARVVCNV